MSFTTATIRALRVPRIAARLAALATAASGFLLTSGFSHAMHALDVTSADSVGNGADFSVGWEFKVSQKISVTALGQFDPNSNPKTNTVAIYQRIAGGGGTQLVSASVLATSPVETSGIFPARYEAVTPVVLPVGDYVIMSTQNGEDFIGPGGNPTATFGAGITWVNGVAFSGTAGPLPTTAPASWQVNNSNPIRYIGPTFNYELVPAADILTFGPGAAIGAVAGDAATITWLVPQGTDVTTLAPTFTLSTDATCTVGGVPAVSGETRDFTNPVAYTVTSSDLATVNTYTVKAIVALEASHAVDLLSVGSGPQFGDTFSVGWDFTVSQAILVTSLGQFDPDSNPKDNTVAIYQRSGAKLVEVSVLSTSPAEPSGNFSARYADISPLVLPPGDYVVMSTQNGDNFIAAGGDPTATLGAGIKWNKGVALAGGSSAGPLPATAPASWPIENTAPFRYFGPTFNYALAPVVPSADMLTFGPGATIGALAGNAAAITWLVPNGSDVTTLAPTFTLSPDATCTVGGVSAVSGETRDFTNPVAYTVTSLDQATVNTYTVTVVVASQAMHALDLMSFGSGAQAGNTFSVGWDFTVNQTILVTALGQFDPDSNPKDNTVAIYQRGGAKLAEISILATSLAEPSGICSARYGAVTTLLLPPGDYVVMSTQNGDNFVAPEGAPTATLGTGIRWNKGVALAGGSSAGPLPATAPTSWPIENTVPFRYFGPTFKYELGGMSTSPTITVSGTLAAVSTNYGAASASPTSFTLSGANLTAGITITPPVGYEVSQTAGGASGYAGIGTAITVGSGGTIASTTIYVRLAATAAVGTYAGNVVCSSAGATTQYVATVPSTVIAVGAIHAVDLTSAGNGPAGGDVYSVGWDFSVNQTISVTSLGQFDPDSNPKDNTVAIYQRGGEKLAEVSVLTTSTAETSGSYPARYADITSLVLPPGDYVIMSTQNGDNFIAPDGTTTATFGTGIKWNKGVALGSGSAAGPLPTTAPLTWPIENSSPYRFLGPTFKYELASTPASGAIMPMGDSITLGVPVAGGYRDPLYTLLNNRGDTFTFVGSLTDYATSVLSNAGQTQHEGHSGYVIANGGGRSGLDENLAGWIGAGAATPDMILLMIGSNDINLGYDMPNAPTRLSTLITHIYGYRPNVKLFVASIIPMVGHETDVQAFNATIPGIVASHKALGRNVVYVPMYEAMNINTDLSDGLHPNALGYQHMAQAWDTALHLNVQPQPFDTWANGTFANGTLTDKDPMHDPDGDGMTNFQEFAFGLDPTTGASVNPVTSLIGNKFTYTKWKDSGLTYTVEYSTDLSAAGWAKAAYTEAAGNPDANGVQIVTVTVANAPADGKIFVRVSAE